ncbi:hypothetical protein QYE76_060722 [Lolium multiflorum]|uniref:Uncharacterized protein n=1 Tax=Lolium multiflorum TaxID=4521 RepID=A0AAD8W6U7_LOLMU|nr:hypothetical protein QYE76_060722 [Lolium multiflorum]
MFGHWWPMHSAPLRGGWSCRRAIHLLRAPLRRVPALVEGGMDNPKVAKRCLTDVPVTDVDQLRCSLRGCSALVAPKKVSAESSHTHEIQNRDEERGVEKDDRYDMWSTVVIEREIFHVTNPVWFHVLTLSVNQNVTTNHVRN